MVEALRQAPAWRIALIFAVLGGIALWLVGPPDEGDGALIVFTALIVLLAAALIVRRRGDGLGICGVMVSVSLGLGILNWPAGVEFAVYLLAVPTVTWFLFDRPEHTPTPRSETRRPARSRS